MRQFKAGDAVKTLKGRRGRVESNVNGLCHVYHGPNERSDEYHEGELTPDYPELNSVAQGLAGVVMSAIASIVPHVSSEMPYKSQYVLEELILELQKRV